MTQEEIIAYQLQITVYGAVGALAVLVWDILDNWHKDCQLLFGSERKGSLGSATAYVVSRFAALGYALTEVIFFTAPMHHCELVGKLANAWCPLALVSTAYLFFLRLCAVYSHSKTVRTTFLLFLLGLLVAVVFVPFSMTGGPRKFAPLYCGYTHVATSHSIEEIAPLVYDTLVFLAISWRLSRNSPLHSSDEKDLGNILFGRNLPAFTRMILQDGQLYYFITLIAGLAAAILTLHPGVPGPLKVLADDPYLALVNIMACRVYRNTLSAVFLPGSKNMDRANRIKASYPIQIIKSTVISQETSTLNILEINSKLTESTACNTEQC